jgi:hypothetical protein
VDIPAAGTRAVVIIQGIISQNSGVRRRES